MADDINAINSGNPIHNGAAVIGQNGLGVFTSFIANSGLTISAIQKPVIEDIDDAYDIRLDDPRYYTGDAIT